MSINLPSLLLFLIDVPAASFRESLTVRTVQLIFNTRSLTLRQAAENAFTTAVHHPTKIVSVKLSVFGGTKTASGNT